MTTGLTFYAALVVGALVVASLGGCREPDIWGQGEAGEVVADSTNAANAESSAAGFAGYLRALSAPPLDLPADRELPSLEELRSFYASRRYQPVWFEGRTPSDKAQQLASLLAAADRQGLDPERYQATTLGRVVSALERAEPEQVWEAEAALTWGALLYAADLAHGRVRPADLGDRWRLSERDEIDLRAWLAELTAADDVAAAFAALSPDHEQYRHLRAARERYRRVVEEGGWPRVPTGPVVGEGDTVPALRLLALAERLHAEGFLDAVPAELPRGDGGQAGMSEELAAAVRRFQESRTLDADGRLGPETQEELNVPAAERLRQIELNLERWRWVPDRLGDPAVIVNVPAYRLDVVEGGAPVLTMNVVVGKPDWPTPVFSDAISYLVLNPYWNIPESIVREEVLPALERNSYYLSEQDMEVLTGWGEEARPVPAEALLAGADLSALRVRQRPGPDNPLGRIKFMFPNADNVYLHDTPSSQLFSRADRYLSHGCVRVERPWDLAAWLLAGDPEWDRERLQAAVASGEHREIALPRKVEVHLVYFTAEIGEDGGLHFYEDIYGIDAAQEAAHRRLAGQG